MPSLTDASEDDATDDPHQQCGLDMPGSGEHPASEPSHPWGIVQQKDAVQKIIQWLQWIGFGQSRKSESECKQEGEGGEAT